jgi:hypothetical protein
VIERQGHRRVQTGESSAADAETAALIKSAAVNKAVLSKVIDLLRAVAAA